MSDFLIDWFKWFEEGISSLDQKSKEKFFSNCGANCVKRGLIESFRNHYIECNNDLDQFILRLSEIGHTVGQVLVPTHKYEIAYPSCSCELHKMGYINTDSICECSRQSIIHVLSTLKPESEIKVEILATILSGDKECRFEILVD
ncbi:hypothetical protein [Fusibacter sp. JL216-2]|uniref:hypothetical protein n=1 Tax=Fusibacter sp. JL216-2 TaxID=3071453 RepID=UPI003D347AFE